MNFGGRVLLTLVLTKLKLYTLSPKTTSVQILYTIFYVDFFSPKIALYVHVRHIESTTCGMSLYLLSKKVYFIPNLKCWCYCGCSYGSLNSVNFLEGVSKGPQWPLYSNLKDKDSLQNYLKRLAAVPSQVRNSPLG